MVETLGVIKALKLGGVTPGEYLTKHYALWLDLRSVDDNSLHGSGRKIENAQEGIVLQLEREADGDGALKCYVYLVMDAQLSIRQGAFIGATY